MIEKNTTFCNAPNCPIKSIEVTISEIKKNQDRFTEKQDTILLILAEQKAITVDLANLKKSIDEFKENMKHSFEDNKDIHVDLYAKINKLEQSKADKTESNRIVDWIWGGVILALSFLLNRIFK